jgi:uracil phosphoribosyltransferase
MFDSQYYNYTYEATEQAHLYPKNVHIVSDPVLVTLLSRLSSNKTTQPQFNDILSYVYRSLIKIVINSHFGRKKIKIETRMIKYNKEALFE